MTEILNMAYGEGGSLGPGPVLIILIPEVRSQFDDVDDFHLYTESPLLHTHRRDHRQYIGLAAQRCRGMGRSGQSGDRESVRIRA